LFVAQVIEGGVVSTTVTVWLHCAWFPHASVARHVRVAVNVLPQVAFVTVLKIVIVFVPHVSLALGASKLHGTVAFPPSCSSHR